MGFFDLNIPYLESDRHATDKSSINIRRLKLTLKAMELGYTCVAYNRTLKGIMSESHRCSTSLFPIAKLSSSSSSSSFFAAVEFHRNLLNVPVSSPFRQYTRLTVVVDIPTQASALNSGDPILRSYDIVAVRPMNQNAFDQACQTSEVDIIAIDLAQKLPFRLEQNMAKAAIKKGVYFEVTYSGLIADAQSRREIISNCTGPTRLANLVSLLGVSMERAKAISKNCRALLASALGKKHFYKEAVKVEAITSVGQINTEKSTFDEWLKWDPISSGEGDLLLDDMKKSLSMSNTMPKTGKAIDFTSIMNSLPAHGLLIKDLIPVNEAAPEPPEMVNDTSADMETEDTVTVHETLKVPNGHNYMPENLEILSENHGNFDTSTNENVEIIKPESQNTSTCQDLNDAKSRNDSNRSGTPYFPANGGACTISREAITNSSENLDYGLEEHVAAEMKFQDTQSQSIEENALPDEQVLVSTAKDEEEYVAVDEVANKIASVNERGPLLDSPDATMDDAYVEREQYREITNSGNTLNGLTFEEFSNVKAKFKETISGCDE